MGKGSSTTVVQNENKPWPPVAQPIKDVTLVATNLAANAVGPGVFPGARTAPMSLPTQAALLGAAREAVTGLNIGKPLLNQFNAITGKGGVNDQLNQARDVFSSVESSASNPENSSPTYRAAVDSLRNVATGGVNSYLSGAGDVFSRIADESTQEGQANPYFERALDASLRKISDRINSYFSGRGRYASGAHNRLLANELGDVAANALFRQFNADRNRALSAAQGLYGVGGAVSGNAARAAGMLLNQVNQDRNARLAAAQGLAGIGNAAIGNIARLASIAPSVDKLRFSDFDRLLNVGTNIQNYQQQLMDETRQIYEEQNTLPWRYINMWQDALNPATVRFGSSSGVNTTKRPWNPVSLLGVPMMAMGFK